MTIDPEFFELMPSYITVNRYTGEDQYGNNTYGTSEVYRCRISLHENNQGGVFRDGTMVKETRLVTSITLDYVEPPFTVRDKVTLPDGRTPTVSTVQTHYDETGPYYISIQCEEARE